MLAVIAPFRQKSENARRFDDRPGFLIHAFQLMNVFLRRSLPLVLILIALIACWNLGMKMRTDSYGNSSDSTSVAPGPALTRRSVDRVGEGPSHRAPRPPLSKNDHEAESVIGSSKVHTIIPAGHSMVTGGCLTADGSREFTLITPHLVENGGKQFLISSCLFKLTAAGLESTGLKSLVTSEEKTEQNAEVWKPEEVEVLLHNPIGMEVVSRPSVYVKPGMSATISSSKRITNPIDTFNTPLQGDQSEEIKATSISIEANEAPNGGTELNVEIISER